MFLRRTIAPVHVYARDISSCATSMLYLPCTYWFVITYRSCYPYYQYAWGGVVRPDGKYFEV